MNNPKADIGLADLLKVFNYFGQNITTSENSYITKCLAIEKKQNKHHFTYKSKHSVINYQNTRASNRSSHSGSETPSSVTTSNKTGNSTSLIIRELEKNIPGDGSRLLPANINTEIPIQNFGNKNIPKQRVSLFHPRTVRGLLTATISQPAFSSEPDISKVISASVQQKHLRQIPMRPRYSTNNGCQLLLDFSKTLIPWHEDMKDLIKQFHALLPEENCPVYEFTNDPLTAIQWTESGEKQWKTIHGKPVIIVTDFGLNHFSHQEIRSNIYTWRKFSRVCRKRKNPLVAITPINISYRTKELEELFPIIEWNRKTTAAGIKHLLNHKWEM